MNYAREQHPEPFWRKQKQCYYVQIGKKQHRLSKHRDDVYQLYHELMSRPRCRRRRPPTPSMPSGRVVELLDLFLEWARKNKAPRTYTWYKENIQRFV